MTRDGWPIGCPDPPHLWKSQVTGYWWFHYNGESDGYPTFDEAYEKATRLQLEMAYELDGYQGS